MTTELFVLRLIHVLGGAFWVGSAIFTTVFLAPAITSAGPSAGAVWGALQKRRLMDVLFWVALLTIASGLRLLWITSGGFSSGYLRTPVGHTFAAAGALAIVAFLVAIFVGRPTGMRSGRLAASMASATPEQRPAIAAEMEKLRRRSTISSAVVATLLVLSASGMAVARYLN